MRRLLPALLFLFFVSPVYAAIDLTIADIPETIHQDDVFSLSYNLTQATSASNPIYLRAVIYQEGTTKYFGYTQNQLNEWINSTSDKTKFLEITVSPEGTASGILRAKFDLAHSYYVGAGVYKVKVGRYTSATDSGADWSSNELEIALTTDPSPSPSPSPTLSPSPTPSPSPSPSPSLSPSPRPSPKSSPSPTPDLEVETGTIAGESTEIDLSEFGVSPSPSIPPNNQDNLDHKLTLNQSRAKIVLSIGSGLLIISLVGLIGYRRYLDYQAQKE